MYRLPRHLTERGTTLDQIMEYRIGTGQGPSDIDSFNQLQQRRTGQGSADAFRLALMDGRTLKVDYEPMSGGGWVSTHQDITEATRAEAEINHLARHDALTELANRVEFRDKLDEALRAVPRGDSVAVLCLDLDQFKAVNDTLGHPVGDELLKVVADRLRGCIRDTDTIARLGGDEFAVIQMAGPQPTAATVLAGRIIETLSAPYTLADHQVVIGTSLGIAMAPEDGTSADQLLKNADMALYRAKSDGRGIYRFFERTMDAKMQARRALELDLRKALENEEFELFYQPLVSLSARKIVAFEALLRWHHPTRGLVSPADFIPLAEDIGLIVPLGAWVLHKACAEAATWPDCIKVTVNLSPIQFKTNTLVLNVLAALASSGLSPQRLELEITETVMLQDTDVTLATLRDLKAVGVSISMDDFGTGYSSLSYLRKFPFDKIKIDQSFVRGLSGEHESLAIVRAVTGLGRSLGMTTTAEGVETLEQLQTLRAEGCSEVQGYLFSPAVPTGQLVRLIEDVNRSLKAA
jgi:diguanylate cyclase (GGDEF)-like protein